MQISGDLKQLYSAELNTVQTDARITVQEASSSILTYYTSLITEQENILACQTALEESAPEHSTGLRAPKQSSYASYEEYAAKAKKLIHSQGEEAKEESAE